MHIDRMNALEADMARYASVASDLIAAELPPAFGVGLTVFGSLARGDAQKERLLGDDILLFTALQKFSTIGEAASRYSAETLSKAP